MTWLHHAPRGARTLTWLTWLTWTLCCLIGCGGGGGGGGGEIPPPDDPAPPVLSAPAITAAPQDLVVQEGAPARFSVTASGRLLTFAWQLSGRAIDVEHSELSENDHAELVIAAAKRAQDGAIVTVIVTNSAGSVQASARLNVTAAAQAPAITTQPQPLRLLPGEAARLSVVASGAAPLSYQWFRDGVALDGATADTLVLAAAAAADAGTYHVVVRNAGGQIQSAEARVTVAPQRPQLAAGNNHTLALKADGTVWAWGDNSAGQLGDGSDTSRSQPVQVLAGPTAPLTGIVAVAAGNSWSLALRSDGVMLAWGRRPGDKGGDPAVPAPVLTGPGGTPLSGVTAISAGSAHALALLQDGRVMAWGPRGELLGNAAADGLFPAPVLDAAGQPITGMVSVQAGFVHSLAVHRDGSLWAWGDNRGGQLGDGTALLRNHAAQVLDGSGVPLAGIRSAGAALQASYAVHTDGTVLAWGSNTQGLLGDGTQIDRPLPDTVLGSGGKPLSKVQALSGGTSHALALDADGCVHSWGSNANFKLGISSILLSRSTAGPVESTPSIGLCGAKSIAGGYGEASFAIDASGQVLGWGSNENGRLGDGTATGRRLPVKVLVPGSMF